MVRTPSYDPINKLERDWKEFLGVKHATGYCNGTNAITANFFALNLPPGSEITVPSYTFFATIAPMPESNSMFDDNSDRRLVLDRRTVMLGPLATMGLASGLLAASTNRLIPEENQRSGTTDWLLTHIRTATSRSKVVEGYCRQQSVEAGQTLEICVSTDPPRSFTVDIYRMGYYDGAGGRLMHTIGPMKGRPQPEPPVGKSRLRECQWEVSASISVPKDWPSGVYVGKLATLAESQNEHSWHSYVIFIVRDGRRADVLYQASDNTWAAYNRWPDLYSLYDDPRDTFTFDVAASFDRPYTKNPHTFDHPLTLGAGHFFLWEFPLVFWLEQHGYDVTYVSNSDMIDQAQYDRTKVFISSGHDEYWDRRQYDSAMASIQQGVTHLYLCGNAVNGVTPFSDSSDGRPNRIINRMGRYQNADRARAVQAKSTIVADKTKQLMPGPPTNKLLGVHTTYPPNGGGDWICTKPDHWIFAGTGMKQGDRIPGLVGHEWHGDPADIPGLEVVAHGHALHKFRESVPWASTIYPGPKGNFVYSASTVWWNQGLTSPPGHVLQLYHGVRCLGPDQRVQQITHNLLRHALE